MLFAISKLLWFLAQPSSLLGLMVLAGLGLASRPRTAKAGLRLAVAGAMLTLLLGLSPLSTLAMRPLERLFPPVNVTAGSSGWTGIIVLGGAEDARVSQARGQLHLNEAAERITEGGVLALKLPTARLVFTGGAGLLLYPQASGVDSVSAYWQSIGIPRDRIVLEGVSRNTYENALATRDLLKPKPGEKWLLVTSAWHMPRAMGLFRRAGFDVTAYPVDFRTEDTNSDLVPFHSIPGGLRRLDDVTKEWCGLLASWLLGRTSSILPGP